MAELTPEKKLFYIYLLTNDKTSTCGIYEITKRQMSFDTGYTVDTITQLLNFLDKTGKVKYCQETQEICIVNWKRYNDSKSPKVQSLIATELQKVKNKAFIEYISPSDTVSIQYQTKSDVDIEIDIELEVEKEIEVESTLQKIATPVISSPLGLMTEIWKRHFPNYIFIPKTDNPNLREISIVLFSREPSLVDSETLKKEFSSFCMKVKSNQFYRDKSLGTIKNKIQDILMHQGNNGLKPSLKTTELDSGVPQDEYAKYAQKVNA